MDDNTGLPQQPDTTQQPPLMKKKNNLIWITCIIPLLIVNVLFVSWANYQLSPDRGGANLSFIVVFPLALLVAIIDFIAVFFYIRKHSNGIITEVISYTVFIATSFVLTYFAWTVIVIMLMGYIDFPPLIVSPPFSAAIAIIATILIVGFLRPKSRK